jgi:hypothetical protein
LDYIFIDGNEKFLPWNKNGLKFTILIKMCKLEKKNLFAGGFAYIVVLYFLSTNYMKVPNIINSNGEIKCIEQINQLSASFISNLKNNDYFLDFVSGDLYHYDNITYNWIPQTNIGLHKSGVAEINCKNCFKIR